MHQLVADVGQRATTTLPPDPCRGPAPGRSGRFIRLTRLDELPQLFAIISRNMSFVGPRPERPHFVDMLSDAKAKTSWPL